MKLSSYHMVNVCQERCISCMNRDSVYDMPSANDIVYVHYIARILTHALLTLWFLGDGSQLHSQPLASLMAVKLVSDNDKTYIRTYMCVVCFKSIYNTLHILLTKLSSDNTYRVNVSECMFVWDGRIAFWSYAFWQPCFFEHTYIHYTCE